jgi:hypothetical protein
MHQQTGEGRKDETEGVGTRARWAEGNRGCGVAEKRISGTAHTGILSPGASCPALFGG